jgi:cob(I)alamin adenosyltransferase
MVGWLEERIDAYMARVDLPPKFVVPGGTELSAALDLARTLLRRAERRIVALARTGALDGSAVLRYVNRASDLLFAMARFADEPDPEVFQGRDRSAGTAS